MKKNFLLLFLMCLLGGMSSSLWAQFDLTYNQGTQSQYTLTFTPIEGNECAVQMKKGNGPSENIDMVIPATVEYNSTTYTVVKIPNNAFSGDNNYLGTVSDYFTSLTIPNTVTTISSNAFKYWVNCTTVTLGEGVTSISNNAFANSTAITTIYCYAETPPTCGGNSVFTSTVRNNATVYVPANSIDDYKKETTSGYSWAYIKTNNFKAISSTPTAPDAPTLNSPADGVSDIFNPNLNFTLGKNTTHYQISIAEVSGTNTGDYTALTPWVKKSSNDVSYQTSDLKSNTTYLWKVVARNGGGETDPTTESTVYSFTTKEITAAPNEIENATPNNVEIADSNPKLEWEFAENTEDYQVVLDGEIKVNWTNKGTSTTGSYQTSNLGAGTHTWQVNTRNSAGTKTGTEYSFTVIGAPGKVTPIFPLDGATGIAEATIKFRFAESTTHYRVFFATTDDTNPSHPYKFLQPLTNDWVATNGASEMEVNVPVTLTLNKKYYWTVEVKNGAGETKYFNYVQGKPIKWDLYGDPIEWEQIHTPQVDVYTFTSASTLPVTYAYPANNAVANEVNPVLSWNYQGSAAWYQVLFGTSEDNLAVVKDWTARGSNDSFQTTGLNVASQYYWQVNVKETENSEVLYGEIVSFITKLEVPQNVSANPEEVEPTLGEYGSTQISWNDISGATGYNVYLDGEKLNSTTTNSYTVKDTDLKIKSNMDPGYNFTVTALYEGYGESGVSEAVNVKVANVGMLIVYIKDPNNNPIEGASIELSGISEFGKEKTYTIHSDATGKGSQSILVADYAITISKDNYISYNNSVKIEKNKEKILNVTLASEYIYNVTAKETETNGNIEITLTNKEAGYYDIYLKTNESESLKIVDGAFFSLNGTSSKYEYKSWNTLANGTYQFGVANFNSDIINWSNEITRNYAIFNKDGNWNTASNWETELLPQEDEKVLIYANATIAATDVITAKNVEIKTGGSLTIDGSLTADMVVNGEEEALCINDGGQLRQGNTKLKGKFVMNIKNWTENKDRTGWQFISSPVTDALISQFIPAEGDYDLYKYDGSKEAEWVNYKSTGDDSGNNPGNDPNQPDDNDITSSFSFDFEDGTMNGWRKYEGDGATGGGWQVTADDESFYLGYNDSKGIYSISYDSDLWTEYIPLNYIVTTKAYKITETSELSWFMRPTDAMYCEDDKYQVIASRDGVNFDIILGSYEGNSNNYNLISLNDYADQELYFGFYHYSDGDLCDAIVLDNIILKTESKTRNMRSFEEEKFESGRAYLASYETAITATFKGTLNYATSHTYTVSYTEGKALANFHLLGNPFTFDMDLNNVEFNNVYEAFATVDPTTGGYIKHTKEQNKIISVGDGFFVEATGGDKPSISYNAGSKSRGEKYEYLNVIASGKQGSNNVIIKLSGKEERGFSKLENLNQSIADLYVKNNGRQYSVLGYDKDVKEVELFFDAKEMGNYSISIEPNGEFESVTLVDRMTGIETNMLLDSYTFTATANDNPNRFLIRLANGEEPTANSQFVYQSGEELIINAEGTIQIIDMMGRMVYSSNAENSRINVSNLKGATYIVRNITDNDVKVQKVVIY